MRKLPLLLLAVAACGGEGSSQPDDGQPVDIPHTVWVTTDAKARFTGDRAVVEVDDAGVHLRVEALGPERAKWLLEARGGLGDTIFSAEVIGGTIAAPGEASLLLEGPGVLQRANDGTIEVELDRGTIRVDVNVQGSPELSGFVEGGYEVRCVAADPAVCQGY